MAADLRECIILAGGRGTRLSHLIPGLPKPLAPVAGRPFLHYLLEYLQSQHIGHFVFSLGHLSSQIIGYLEKEAPHLRKTYVTEDEPLGTGGAIIRSMEAISTEDFFVVNADTYYPVSLDALMKFHTLRHSDLSLALKPMLHPDRYGTVTLSEEGRIMRFEEKKSVGFGLINGGVYCVRAAYLQGLGNRGAFSFEKEVLESRVLQDDMGGMISDEFFIDIGVPQDYDYAGTIFRDTEHFRRKRALFLDRDGVINQMIPGDYVRNWEDFRFVKGCLEHLGRVAGKFDYVFVVTNQQCIGKGLVTAAGLDAIHARMEETLEKAGVRIERILHCPHLVSEACACRKPMPGMLDRIRMDYPDIDFTRSLLIGDSESDMLMAASRHVPAIRLMGGHDGLPGSAGSWKEIEQMAAADH